MVKTEFEKMANDLKAELEAEDVDQAWDDTLDDVVIEIEAELPPPADIKARSAFSPLEEAFFASSAGSYL